MFAASKTDSVSDGGYQISRSLRFNRSDSPYLNRSPTATGSRTTFTLSLWLKLGNLNTGSDSVIWASGNASTGNPLTLLWKTFSTNYYFNLTGGTTEISTTPVYRDPSAWYHIVLAIDTTQATDTNRIKLYVNGVQVTSLFTANYPAQNLTYDINTSSYPAYFGCLFAGGFIRFWEGYQTEINFIDGQQLTPSSFGETNIQTGVWQPKAFSGGAYGTNGFYLNFSDNSNTTAATLGKDYSGNGNNWTPNNFSVTAGAGNDSLVDVPTPYGVDTGAGGTVRGNYATLNPLYKSTNVTASNGNLDAVSIAQVQTITSTFFLSNGKWYAEFLCNANGLEDMLGIIQNTFDISSGSFYVPTQILFGRLGNVLYYSGSSVITSPSWVTGDTLQLALDLDNQTLAIAKNGGSFNTITITSYDSHVAGQFWSFGIKNGASGGSGNFNYTANFGQRPFAYTAPSGFKALCTQNLPTPTIGATSATLATKFFNSVLFTSTGVAGATVTGVGFQPDFSWWKSRATTAVPILVNTLTGSNNYQVSSSTSAQQTFANIWVANSDGYTSANGSFNANDPNVAWNWKANGTGVSNTSGSITSTVSANTTSGFSVVTFTAPSSGSGTVGHGLGVAPNMMIWKSRSDADSWTTYHTSLGGSSALFLNSTVASFSLTWGTINSTIFTADTSQNCTASRTYVAYCFSSIAGYSAFGSYVGNGNANGTFVYTGFRPAFIMVKASSGTSAASANWLMLDDARNTYNEANNKLAANIPSAENSGTIGNSTQNNYDFLSNGFKATTTNGSSNESGTTFIYMAFAENPFKYSLAR